MDEKEFLARLGRIESLVQSLDTSGDPRLRANAKELLQAVLDLHRVGLTKFLSLISAAPGGAGVLDACAEDELVRSLLLLHGLHPRDLESRIFTALETIQPFLRDQQSRVELLGVGRGVVRLRLYRKGDGPPLMLQALRDSVEGAVWAGAPDAAGLEIEEADIGPSACIPRLSLPMVGNRG